MNLPRKDVAALLLPAFLPFNLIKGGLNTAFTLLIYKPVVSALRRARLIEPSVKEESEKRNLRLSLSVTIVSLILIFCLAAVILIFKG